MYNDLNISETSSINLSRKKINKYLNLIINNSLVSSLSNEYSDKLTMEDKIIDEMYYKAVFNEVEQTLDYVPPKNKVRFYKKFGLGDEPFIEDKNKVSKTKFCIEELFLLRTLKMVLLDESNILDEEDKASRKKLATKHKYKY